MSIPGAVDIAYRQEIEEAEDSDNKRKELIQKFTNRTGPVRAAEGMGIDAVIDPEKTRNHIITALERSRTNRNAHSPPRKHGINPW
jgi:acetyl-CoA carboxylase carboxyltransferase component